MKYKLVLILLLVAIVLIAQDDPTGYTNNYGLRMWDEGDHPGADSVNQNLIDIDQQIYNRDLRIDSLKTAYSWMFNFPSGTFKRYNSNEFDNDTLKVKSGVFPKLADTNIFTGINKFSNMRTDFGDNTSGVLNFNIANDLGAITIKKNNTTDLLTWDESDGNYWQFLYPIVVTGSIDASSYYLNGVPFSGGGGDVYLGNRQTFTSRNVFSDTLKADGLSLIDDARITSQLKVTGDVTSDLNFLQGARTKIGTIDNYGFVLKTADTNRLVIDSLGYATFNKQLAVGKYIIATDSVTSASLTTDNLYINNFSNGIIFRGYNSQISEDVNQLKYTSRQHNFLTKGGYNFIANLDSSTGMNLIYGDYYKNGVLLFDSSKFARTESSISELFNSVVTFASAVYFSAAATFNSTLTAAGDFIPTWTKNNSASNYLQYEKTKIVKTLMPANTSSGAVSTAHGITDWHSIKSWTAVVMEDSTNFLYNVNQYYGTGAQWYARVDSLNVYTEIGGTAYPLRGDSVFFRIVYTDYNR